LPTATVVPLKEDQYHVNKAYLSSGNRGLTVAMIEVVDKKDENRLKVLSAGKNKFGVLA